MTLPITFPVPSLSGAANIEINGGSSIVFIGANGAGKTRLGVYLDKELSTKVGFIE